MTPLLLLAGGVVTLAAVAAAPAPWERDQAGVRIPMRDGESLAADILLPEKPGQYPTILIQTPYSRKRFGAALPDVRAAEGLVDRERYAYVLVDWRGFYDSKGALKPGTMPRRGQDGFDVVEWIARQPWSDGKVGTWGPSALGKIQFMTAVEHPPHLVCCVPVVAAEGYAYDDFYENGVYREAHVKLLDRLGFGLGRLVYPATRSSAVGYRLALMAGRAHQVDVPVLMITGWYDPGIVQQLRTFATLRTRAGDTARRTAKLLIGPWTHTAVGQAEQGALSYPGAANERDRVSRLFFDAWLRGERASAWEQTPAFRWWQMGEERWLSAESPEAVKTAPRTFFLHADGTLNADPPRPNEPARAYTADPKNPVPTMGGANVGFGTAGGMGIGPLDQRPLEKRDDVLVYSTEPLREPLRVFGAVKVGLTFSIDRPDASFAVRLCDVTPDGRAMLVNDGIARAIYREGTDRPAPAKPGETYTLSVELPPTGLTLTAGHRLRILVAGSNHPRFELNPHTGADHYDAATAVPARCTLLHTRDRPMTLVVPVLGE